MHRKEGMLLIGILISGILIAGLALTGASVIMILTDQHETSLREFAILGLFCSILIMLSYYVELNNPGFAAKIDAVKFGYIGRVFINPLLRPLLRSKGRQALAVSAVSDSADYAVSCLYM